MLAGKSRRAARSCDKLADCTDLTATARARTPWNSTTSSAFASTSHDGRLRTTCGSSDRDASVSWPSAMAPARVAGGAGRSCSGCSIGPNSRRPLRRRTIFLRPPSTLTTAATMFVPGAGRRRRGRRRLSSRGLTPRRSSEKDEPLRHEGHKDARRKSKARLVASGAFCRLSSFGRQAIFGDRNQSLLSRLEASICADDRIEFCRLCRDKGVLASGSNRGFNLMGAARGKPRPPWTLLTVVCRRLAPKRFLATEGDRL